MAVTHQLVVLNDDDHSYAYVLTLLCSLLAVTPEYALFLTQTIDRAGRAVVFIGSQQDCEELAAQIHAAGPDAQLPRSTGLLMTSIEPWDGAPLALPAMKPIYPEWAALSTVWLSFAAAFAYWIWFLRAFDPPELPTIVSAVVFALVATSATVAANFPVARRILWIILIIAFVGLSFKLACMILDARPDPPVSWLIVLGMLVWFDAAAVAGCAFDRPRRANPLD